MSEPLAPGSRRSAFVGVGRMGSAMLRCVLQGGYRMSLYDPSEAATAPFVADFPDLVHVAKSAAEAASEAEVVGIAVNTNEQLIEACLGEGGVLQGAHPGTVVLIHSTVSHETLHRLGTAGAERGVHVLDAMVSGARGHLSVPQLAVMVGGDGDAFERAAPVMRTYGSLVLHLGPRGAGLDAKLAINMLRYLCMAAGQEATQLAEKAGVGNVMAELVEHTNANRYVGNEDRLRGMLAVPEAQRRKDAELAQKDLRAAIARGRDLGAALPSAELAMGLMHRLWGTEPPRAEEPSARDKGMDRS